MSAGKTNNYSQMNLNGSQKRGPFENSTKTSSYFFGFDGIRSISVVAVIFYHLLPNIMKGGYLGVPVFLVISGFLITSQLLKEWKSSKNISLGKFYTRRMRRIYPALFSVLLFSSAYITIFERDLLYNLHQVVLSSLLFVNNWWQIIEGFSYFDRFTAESPFTHIWSLAIEGQFYIIIPILLLVLLQVLRKRRRVAMFFVIASVLSAVWMAILFTPGTDPTRVYYGTDTRIFSLFLGVSLAIILTNFNPRKRLSNETLKVLNIGALVSWILILLAFVFLDTHYSLAYYGGIFAVSVLGTIVIFASMIPASIWSRLLSNSVFTWIGKRSYGIYLYQFPVMIFYEEKIDSFDSFVWVHALVKLVIILVISDLSYRFIEIPLQYYDYKSLRRNYKEIISEKKIKLSFFTVIVILALIGIITAPFVMRNADQLELQALIEQNEKMTNVVKENKSSGWTIASKMINKELIRQDEEKLASLADAYGLTLEQTRIAQEMDLTVIGDSVTLGVAKEMKKLFPDAVIDGKKSRQLFQGIDVVNYLENDGLLADTVIIALGTNGKYSEATYDELMDSLAGRRVFWVNIRAPGTSWQKSVNKTIEKVGEKYSNLKVIDWYSYSEGKSKWFYNDFTHTNSAGAKEYVKLVGRMILDEQSILAYKVKKMFSSKK